MFSVRIMTSRSGKVRLMWYLTICFTAVFLVGACASTTRSTRVHPTFDYVPEEVEISEDLSVTFAVVGSSFSSPLSYSATGVQTPIPLFERFSSSMAGDFGEILTARGYTWRGPFRTFDEMTFPDKEGSNLILTAEVEFDYDIENMVLRRDVGASMLGGQRYKASGPITVAGRIYLVVSESVTNERMWTKSVELTPLTVHLEGEVYYSLPSISFADVLANENRFYSELGKRFEDLYHEVMHKAYGYLDPREMELINRKADGLREKKVY